MNTLIDRIDRRSTNGRTGTSAAMPADYGCEGRVRFPLREVPSARGQSC